MGDLIVDPEVLMSGEEDGGDLETPGAHCPPHSVSLTVEPTVNTEYRVVERKGKERERGERSLHITQY